MRAHAVSDFADLAATWGDARVTRFIGGKPSTPEQSWARLLRYAGMWPLLGFGYWAVEERATGRFVGDVGIADFRREMTPRLRFPESGWVTAPWAWGRGFATEALRAALAWADEHLESAGTACIIDAGHEASMRVAAKCGYVETARASYAGDTVAVFERPRVKPRRAS